MSLKGITYYRTRAFHKGENGNALHFWTIDPAYDKPGFYYIREHEAGKSHRYSARITGDITEREALHKIAELEQQATVKHAPADDNPENLRRMGDNYTAALPWRDHPVHLAEARQAELGRLRAKNGPPKFRLKP